MSTDFHVIIPARYQSSRLPGKLLMELQGQTVLERVYRQVLKANPRSITIATDSEIIYERALDFGATVMMTSMDHQSGTDRVAEAVAKSSLSADDIIVNVQGDEPLIPPALITQVAHSLATDQAVSMATLCFPIDDEALNHNPNIVKVVRNRHHHALYFSRAAIPFDRDGIARGKRLLRHIGLYAYRSSFLLEMVSWPVCELEATEALEQLRVLWAGYSIKVEDACVPPLQDINTAEDLEQARRWLEA